jgi:hypothetical protein
MNAVAIAHQQRSATCAADGTFTRDCNDYGWRVEFNYRITQYGTPNRDIPRADGLERDYGLATEVDITRAVLVNEVGNKRVELALAMFSPTDIADVEEEIAAKLDEEQT